jgi:serine/threonine protein kinase
MSVSGQSKASSTVPPEPLEEGDFRWNGLSIEGPPYNLEKIGDYDQGGHHPVHLGDLIQDGRYRVIHKLGSGGFANVWLCRDTESLESTKYVALKILMGDASTDDCREPKINEKLGSLHPDLDQEPGARYISSPLNQFQIQGPNGSHICFVYPVLGPRVISPVSHSFENPDQSLRATCLKCAQAVDYLHSHDICHGGELLSLRTIL